MNPELEQLAQRTIGALVNGLYQGLLLALVLWLGLKLFRGVNAATRHWAGFVTLLVVAALPVLHFLLPHPETQPASDGSSEAVSTQPAGAFLDKSCGEIAFSIEDWVTASVPAWDESAVDLAAGAGAFPSISPEPEPVPDSISPALMDELETSGIGGASELPASPATTSPEPDRPTTFAWSHFKLPAVRQWRAEMPGLLSIVVVLLLAIVAGVRLLRLGWQWWVLLRLKRSATPPDSGLTETFATLRDELRVARPVRLLVDKRITTPMAVGYFRSAVLLPAALTEEASGHGLEGILRHELAHIRRCDDWCNLLQQIIAAVHFYNPAVAWLSRRLTIDREIACDDFALARSASRRDYALLLTEFAGRNRNRGWIAAPAAWSNRSQLKERINMILDPNRNTSRRLARTSAGVLTVAALATAAAAWSAGPRLVLAASTDQAEHSPAHTTRAVTLTAPSGEALIAHVRDVAPVTATASADAAVALSVEHQVAHSVAVASSPDVVVSTRPVVKVAPRAFVAVPGPSGVMIAQAAPQPAQGDVPRAPKAPKPGRAPKAVPTPAAEPSSEKPDESMEERMERLERMIEQLVGGDRKFHFELKPGKEFEMKEFEWQGRINPPGEPNVWNIPHPGEPWDEAQQKAMKESMKRVEKEMERTMKEAHRQMARASEEVERTKRDAELRAQLDLKKEHGRGFKDTEHHRKSLEGQRRGLEREMENLNRQLEQLERQAEQLDEQMERLDEERDRQDEERERQEEERDRHNEEREKSGDADSDPKPKEKDVKP